MNWNNQKGSLLIEVLLSISIAAVFSLAIGNMIGANHQLVIASKQEVEATAYAKESMEQFFAIKQSDWNKISGFSEGFYHIEEVGSEFEIVPLTNPAIPEQELDGKYYRTVHIGNAYRDVSGNLSDTGDVDPDSRRLDVKVSWQERDSTRNIEFTSYVTNWRGQ